MPKRVRLGVEMVAALALALVALALGMPAPAQSPLPIPVVVTPHGDNVPAQQSKPYIILVSLDGFRFDYAQRYGAKNLQALATRGASAPQGMIPAYPSVTFPNHYSIVTGLYPEHHGIVANSFYDPRRRQQFVYTDRRTSADGSWYGGVPLWVLAERQGMRTACFFWPGAEAEIGGMRPTYNVFYDPRIPSERRIDQVVDWLRLPPRKRPHLVTLYFGDADDAGHRTGTNSAATAQAVRRLDGLIARLAAAIALLRLPVNLVVVSDHGMVNTEGPWIDLEEFADLSGFRTVGSLLYPPNAAAAARVYSQLRNASDKFVVYRRNQMPAHLHYSRNPRIGDPVVVPTGPYLIRAYGSNNPKEVPPKGMHGYDAATMPEMRGIFYAAGPKIRPGVRLAPFENVNVYSLVTGILGLEAGAVDGELRVLQPALRAAAPVPSN
jgi:predicted AlkP superfamily pyrophosphatase or phosphodiesterase